jgi:hypothetical protein
MVSSQPRMKTRAPRVRLLAWTAMSWLVATEGCAVVAPYERERLARPDMALGRDVDVAAGEEHATAYREGSSGATGTTGGGCGCN